MPRLCCIPLISKRMDSRSLASRFDKGSSSRNILSPRHTAQQKGRCEENDLRRDRQGIDVIRLLLHVHEPERRDSTDHPNQQAAMGDWGIFTDHQTQVQSRPVYLSWDERVQAHFMACFLSSILYRMFEKRLKVQFTCEEIIARLRKINFPHIKVSRYVSCYTSIDFMYALYEDFGLRMGYEQKQMKAIIIRWIWNDWQCDIILFSSPGKSSSIT